MVSLALQHEAAELAKLPWEAPSSALCENATVPGDSSVPQCCAPRGAAARAYAAAAVALAPRDAVYLSNAASLWLASGLLEGGLALAQAAHQLAPADPNVLINYGYACERSSGDDVHQPASRRQVLQAEALLAYERAVAVAPHHPQAQRNLASLRAAMLRQ